MGLCHAWAPSTLMYKTPGAVTLKGKTGIMVPFGSSDIKALLTLNVHHNIVPYMPPMVGNACKEDFRKANMETIRMTNPALSEKEVKKQVEELFNELCKPVNPGAFHIVLANKLGSRKSKNKQGIIIDVDPGPQVWNQPVYKYRAKIIKATPMEKGTNKNKILGVTKKVQIQNTIYYIKEVHPSWTKVTPVDQNGRNLGIKPLTLDYELYLDRNDKIVGGKWLTKKRIDYVSIRYDELFSSRFSRKVESLKSLKKIYHASIK